MLNGRIATWLADDRGIDFHWIGEPAEDTIRSTRRFTQECADATVPFEKLRHEAQSLYRSLLSQFSKQLVQNTDVLIDGDSAIVDIPWQALVDDNDQYLVQSHWIVRIQSLGLSSKTTPHAKLGKLKHALVVAVSDSGLYAGANSNPARLVDAELEGRSVSSTFPIATLLLDDRAKFREIKREIRSANVFHYAGHTISTGSFSAGLVLGGVGDDEKTGILDAQAIRSFQVPNLRLAVLSACQTQGSDERAFSDADSLALAFLQIGVPEVIASRWAVDSHETAIMMRIFYENIAAGSSPSLSLRAAEIETLRNSETRHPYYWAAFNSFRAS